MEEKVSMQAKTCQIREILNPERRYIIPTFQRDYEWNQEDQWEPLFDDLTLVSDRLLDSSGEPVSPHFLGAIVCGSLPFGGSDIVARSVIDGQQRLTTIQLLCRGLLDVLIEYRSGKIESIRRVLFNPEDIVSAPEERFKLWPRRLDREIWPQVMNDDAHVELTKKSHPYFKARMFFSESCRSYVNGDYDPAIRSHTTEDRLDALTRALLQQFKIVIIDLDVNDDAQVIFEGLNGRQTPLSAIDLVKNLLFMNAEREGLDVDNLYSSYWSQFDDPWWKEKRGTGHAARQRRDILLSTWLTAETCTDSNVGHLYREARIFLDDTPSSTTDVLISINSFAGAYCEIYGNPAVHDEQISTAYRRIGRLEVSTSVPLLAWLRTLPTDTLSPQEHRSTVLAIESWIIRRMYCGWQSRGYAPHFARAIRAGKAAELEGDSIPAAITKSLNSQTLTCPSDDEFRFAIINSKFYGPGGHSQRRTGLLLSAIDQQLRDEDPAQPSTTIDYEQLEIEHVLPMNWERNWPIFDNGQSTGSTVVAGDANTARAHRDQCKNRLGNLTLVTSAFNKNLSNSSWENKRQEFAKQRTLMLNYQVAEIEEWDEGSIGMRGGSLAEVAIRIWPHPSKLVPTK